jgi:hypothetical protein
VVRGPAALLGLVAAALAYFAAAPALPGPAERDVAVALAGTAGLSFVVALATLPSPAVSAPLALVPAALGALMVAGALNAAEAGAVATPVEAVLCGCAGVAFAIVLDVPALAIALPLFVAAVDVSGLAGGAPGTLVATGGAAAGDPLTLELPGWGGGPPVVELSVADVVFLATYAGYAQRFSLRPRASALAMLAALIAALLLTLAFDRRAPALAFVSIAFLLVNAPRMRTLLATPRGG